MTLGYFYIVVILQLLFTFSLYAHPVGKEVASISPNNVQEMCVMVQKFPGSEDNYSKSDIEDEEKFCKINFYEGSVALCPKTWSTSPGTMVYDASKSGLSTPDFEVRLCGRRDNKTIAKFKQTMNQANTSGTFSTSSLLYYHFSRYFNMDVNVPVSVYRSMDRYIHLKRIVENVKPTTNMSSMNRAGWEYLANGDRDPNTYKPKSDLYTDDDKQIFGILIRDKGERYGVEINGTRESGWGAGQNYDLQKTAPFTALKTSGALLDILPKAIATSFLNSRVKAATGTVSNEQMIFWMKELSEITLLDYIFAQQDRVGNIDYRWYWYWIDEKGQGRKRVVDEDSLKHLPRTKMSQILKNVPQDIAQFKPILLQRTQLNDNDAGARGYANFTKKTQMLEGMRHYSAKTYRKLIDMSNDFKTKGPLYNYVSQTFELTPARVSQIVKNTVEAADILKGLCQSGTLKFDLKPKDFIRTGQVAEESINCN